MTCVVERGQSNGLSYIKAGQFGAVTPLVMLHGIGSNASSYAALMACMAGDRPVVAWDAPGYGGSEPLQTEWPSVDDYASALARLLDQLGLERVDLMGHSLGALVAGRFALRFAARVDRLVLASPALGYGTRPGGELAPAAAARLQALVSEGAERFAASRGPRLVHARHHASLVAGVVKAMSEVRLPGYAHASRMLSCGDLVLDGIQLPMRTLVLVGAEDEVTPPQNCRRLFEAMVAAKAELGHRLEIVPDAGHALPQEQPRVVADIIARFAPISPA
jgi:pimeloyl-ACP methyl ester carboxylesterase